MYHIINKQQQDSSLNNSIAKQHAPANYSGRGIRRKMNRNQNTCRRFDKEDWIHGPSDNWGWGYVWGYRRAQHHYMGRIERAIFGRNLFYGKRNRNNRGSSSSSLSSKVTSTLSSTSSSEQSSSKSNVNAQPAPSSNIGTTVNQQFSVGLSQRQFRPWAKTQP